MAETVEKHPHAVAGELVRHGLRLRDVGTDDFTYHDFFSFLTTFPPDSHFARTVFGDVKPDELVWTQETHLLADIVDILALQLWSGSEDAAKKRNKSKPKPYPRPGREEKGNAQTKVYKVDKEEMYTLEEIMKLEGKL